MNNTTSKPDGRTLTDFDSLSPAEQQLLDACQKGECATITEHRPIEKTPTNTVRASFLRFLALGGDERAPVHEKGVLLLGAWIEGELDLEGTMLPQTLELLNCHFDLIKPVVLRDSNVRGSVIFKGCHLNGLEADRIVCSGSVFLKEGFIATSKVSLIGAQIGGDMECHDGKFYGKDGNALICERAVIKGCVFLRDGFLAIGTVRLNAVKIDGNLECDGGKFDVHNVKGGDALRCDRAEIKGSVFLRNSIIIGTVWLMGVEIGGDLDCTDAKLADNRPIEEHVGTLACEQAVIKGKVLLNGNFNGTVRLNGTQIGGNLSFTGATLVGTNGKALIAQNMMVAGMFFFRERVSVEGVVSLAAAKVGTLVDDLESWPKELELNGFVYDGLDGKSPTDAKSRLAWLNKQSASHKGLDKNGKDFRPQPWRQLQKVLREMGHNEDARQVAIAFEVQLRKANLIGQTPESWCEPIACLSQKISRGFHWLFGRLIGYGYRPLRLFLIMLAVWLVFGMIYWGAALNGVFAPSNPLVFQNSEYAVCVHILAQPEHPF